MGVDLVAASFVGNAGDVRDVRELAGDIPVIAKLERTVAYRALDEIIREADGVMVARGDLGVELSWAALPRVQKDIIARTNAGGKISITATEMLESMKENSPPDAGGGHRRCQRRVRRYRCRHAQRRNRRRQVPDSIRRGHGRHLPGG